MSARRRFGMAMAFVVLAVWSPRVSGQAATAWNGATGNWSQVGNWTYGVPAAGMDVVITNGSVLLDAETPVLNLFQMTGGTLVFSNWTTRLNATNITLGGGVVTLPAPFTDSQMSNRVWFACSNDFAMGTSAVINVDGKGYVGTYSNGYGPGKGLKCSYGSGGGHGGVGGHQSPAPGSRGGATNDSPFEPSAPGSSGGHSGNAAYGVNHGGGVVLIEAGGRVTMDGFIQANGLLVGASGQGGGGAGGAVLIRCRTFSGKGSVFAKGYNGGSGYGGGGGGGRIAVLYNAPAQSNESPFQVIFNTAGGIGNGFYSKNDDGEMGTLYFPDQPLLRETLGQADVGQLIMPGVTNWAPNTLSITGACNLRFPEAFQLAVANSMTLNGGVFDFGMKGSAQIGGSLILTNGGGLIIRSGPTNAGDACGAALSIADDLTIGANSALTLYSHPTNGGAPKVSMRHLAVLANGKILADGGGFAGGFNSANGWGPGGGKGIDYGSGGAYGGRGGFGADKIRGGVTNGAPLDPRLPGSGGGGWSVGGEGGNGGGLIWVEARGDVTVNGTVSANGNTPIYYAGGGAGGGVWITGLTFRGTGVIQAKGSTGANIAGGGGGGRIAVFYDPVLQAAATPVTVTFDCAPGNRGGEGGENGEKGTFYFPPALRESVSLAHKGVILLPGQSSWDPTSLVVSAACDLQLPDGLTVSVASNLTVATGRMTLGKGAETTVGGSVIVTNGGVLALLAGATNGLAPDAYGALLAVTGSVSIYTNSWIVPVSDPMNGGSPLLRMKDLKVWTGNAGINADGYGFAGGQRADNLVDTGRGPGGGLVGGHGSGGGYGGAGGDSKEIAGTGGKTNGNARYPFAPGSGGGSYGGWFSGNGGGLIRLEARGDVVLNGTFTANGSVPPGANSCIYNGGGSGGGIFIRASRLIGSSSAKLSADGGTAVSTSWAGSGGGGRICVWYNDPKITDADRQKILSDRTGQINQFLEAETYPLYAGVLSVTNGAAGFNLGKPGTVRFLTALPPPSGTVLFIR